MRAPACTSVRGWRGAALKLALPAVVGICLIALAALGLRELVQAAPNDTAADQAVGQGNLNTGSFNACFAPSAGAFCYGGGIALDAAGRLYVADASNNRVLRFDTPGTGATANAVFGQNNSFTTKLANNGGSTNANGLDYPHDVAVDTQGNVYIADYFNNRVLEYDDPFNSDTLPDMVIGQTSFTGNGLGVGATQLAGPYGLAVDSNDNLYVADRQNHRVLLFLDPTNTDTTADKVFGQGPTGVNFAGNTAAWNGTSATSMFGPMGLGLDAADNLYVADASHHRVLTFFSPVSGDVVADRVIGQGATGLNMTSGQVDFPSGTTSALGLEGPTDVTVDIAGNVYVSETGNERALGYDNPLTTDYIADQVYGQPNFTSFGGNSTGINPSSMADGWSIAVDFDCRLYIEDFGNSRVLIYDQPPPQCQTVATATPTGTACPVPICTATPTATATATGTPTPDCMPPPPCDTPTASPTHTPTSPADPTNTPTPTATNTPTATSTPPTVSTPTRILVALDCNPVLYGVQSECTVATGPGTLTIDVIVKNETLLPMTIAAFNFQVNDPDTSRLNPPPSADLNLDSNPDFNQQQITGSFTCNPPPPDNDTGALGPGAAQSRLVCYTGALDGPVLPPEIAYTLARVTYDIPASAQPGSVTLDLDFVAVYDNELIELGSCEPAIDEPAECESLTVTLVSAGPSVEKIPEGNANNVDPSIPAANLWICETGPCAGPGEGSLIVHEYASGVSTGDQNGDTVEDGLGAYEFSVEYENLVVQSANPQDIVFNPGPIAPYPNGSDGVPDGEGANRAPATCNMSLVFENVVHFGCVTAGALPAGLTGSFDLARLELVPHPDLTNDIFPGNSNGVVTVIKDNGCELVDVFGHPVEGSVNGGLTPVCGDLAVTVRILEGDLNLDCEVDVADQQLIAFRYGSFFGSLLYSEWYDLEPALHDLDIDIKDVQKVFGRDGSTCQQPVPPQPPEGPPAPFATPPPSGTPPPED